MARSIPKINYTPEDLEKLKDFVVAGSPITMLLKMYSGDPDAFCEKLRCVPFEWDFIYNTPLCDLPLTMSNPRFEGWRRWRFSIGK